MNVLYAYYLFCPFTNKLPDCCVTCTSCCSVSVCSVYTFVEYACNRKRPCSSWFWPEYAMERLINITLGLINLSMFTSCLLCVIAQYYLWVSSSTIASHSSRQWAWPVLSNLLLCSSHFSVKFSSHCFYWDISFLVSSIIWLKTVTVLLYSL